MLFTQVLEGHSLWARILQHKYGINRLDNGVTLYQSDSRLWRQLIPHFQTILSLAIWKIGAGNISFWRTNWLGKILDIHNQSALTIS